MWIGKWKFEVESDSYTCVWAGTKKASEYLESYRMSQKWDGDIKKMKGLPLSFPFF